MIDIKATVRSIREVTQRVSGLRDFEGLICSYYCLATWFVKHINPFPLLNVTGPNGTGKTSLLAVFNRLAFQPHMFTAKGMSGPVFRDELGEVHEGTAIIDECDSDKDDVEALLMMRYLRETAVAYKKVPADVAGWKTVEIPIFGPSIIHKRLPFKDPALEGRSISISTVPNMSQKYIRDIDLDDNLINGFRVQQMDILESTTFSQNCEVPEGVAPRIADSYRPLINLASIARDEEFLKELWIRLKEATQNLKDGQSYEPGPIVVQALISALTKNGNLAIKNVKLEGELVRIIQYDFGHNLNSPQIARILRGYGFTLKRIGGPYSVIPDINTLVKVCKAIGIEDEAVEKAAQKLVNIQKPG